MLKAPVAGTQGAAPVNLKSGIRLDPATLVGLVGGFAAMIVSFTMEGGEVSGLVNTSAALIVFGGTICAAVLSSPLGLILNLPRVIMKSFASRVIDEVSLIDLLASLAETARRDGLLSLEARCASISDPFLKRGVQLVVDGAEPETVREVLDLEMEQTLNRHELNYGVLEAMGGFAPTMGIIGTVMGLVHVLGSLADPSKLGPAISVAFIATLYGVSTANLIWLPLGSKLKKLSEREMGVRHLMVQGLLAIQAGENPRVVREKLMGFLPPAKRISRQAKAEGKGKVKEAAA